MSRHQFHVATSLLSIMRFPGRDEIHVATSHTAAHVATSKMMSRHQLSSAPFLLRRDAIFPCRDLPCCHPCRDLKNDVATSIPTGQITTKIFQVATPKGHPTSRPQFDVATPTPLVQVATPTGRRDLALSGPSRARVAQAVGARWRCCACFCARGHPCPAHLLPSCHDLNTRS